MNIFLAGHGGTGHVHFHWSQIVTPVAAATKESMEVTTP